MTGARLWPAELTWGPLVMRPLRRSDRREYVEVRKENAGWLRPWEATVPDPTWRTPGFSEMRALTARAGREGRSLPFALQVAGRFRGQLTVSGFQWGSLASANLGYWIDRRVAGQGHTPIAVALATDHCFAAGLHRMEVAIRPENAPSLRVVEKLGFRDEGVRERYMHIDGDWRDHRIFSLLSEDVPFGLMDWYTHEYGLSGGSARPSTGATAVRGAPSSDDGGLDGEAPGGGAAPDARGAPGDAASRDGSE